SRIRNPLACTQPAGATAISALQRLARGDSEFAGAQEQELVQCRLMHIECPHCQNPIDVVDDRPTEQILCPSCGSSFSLFDPDQTRTFREQQVRAIGRFRVLEHLGSGHFGDVWLSYDPTLERNVALKIPRKEDLTRDEVDAFLREARAAAQLKHPNIVQVLEVGTFADLVFIVSEYVRGVNLAEWLADAKPDSKQAAEMCAR